jgi:hypothetical protein
LKQEVELAKLPEFPERRKTALLALEGFQHNDSDDGLDNSKNSKSRKSLTPLEAVETLCAKKLGRKSRVLKRQDMDTLSDFFSFIVEIEQPKKRIKEYLQILKSCLIILFKSEMTLDLLLQTSTSK